MTETTVQHQASPRGLKPSPGKRCGHRPTAGQAGGPHEPETGDRKADLRIGSIWDDVKFADRMAWR